MMKKGHAGPGETEDYSRTGRAPGNVPKLGGKKWGFQPQRCA